jgi:hypothetical protein
VIRKAAVGEQTTLQGVDYGSGEVTVWQINRRFIVTKQMGYSGWASLGESQYYATHFDVYERTPDEDTETHWAVENIISPLSFGSQKPVWY